MTQTRPTIRILPGHHKRVRTGHPWVYSNEIEMNAAAKALPPGTVVRVMTAHNEDLGTATFNPHNLIAARFLSQEGDAVIDAGFLAGKIARALATRDALFPEPYYRLVHAEADGLPGLIVDRFGDVLSVQTNTAGMELLAEPLRAALMEVLKPKSIILRNDTGARAQEGLPLHTEVIGEAIDGPVTVIENGVRYQADLVGGQKTGWFFDQRDNRAFIARLSAGKRVLDAYTYLGGFGLAAARAGASDVTCIDRSESSLALAAQTAEENGFADRCHFTRGEVFDKLDALGRESREFDVVICDPPAFVKAKKDFAAGIQGYRKLVRLAAPLVAPGGYLFIASCSHNVEAARFHDEVAQSLHAARRTGRILRSAGAAPDHPEHPLLPQSVYLKALVFALD